MSYFTAESGRRKSAFSLYLKKANAIYASFLSFFGHGKAAVTCKSGFIWLEK